jgi:hypothetical protein
MNDDRSKHLATTAINTDGYDDDSETERINGPFVKFLDGEWTIGGMPLEDPYQPIALAVAHTLTRWRDQSVIDEIADKPLPDLDALNAAIPKGEWELDMDGKPRPPWSSTLKIFFFDTATGERAIYATATIGGNIAVSEIADKVRMMRRLRGSSVYPVVKLKSKPMKTKFRQRPRPFFEVQRWITLGGGEQTLPAPPTPRLPPAHDETTSGLGGIVEEPSTREEINDDIPL